MFYDARAQGAGGCSNLGHPEFIAAGRNVDLPPVATSVSLGETHSNIFEGFLFYLRERCQKEGIHRGQRKIKYETQG